MFREDFYVVFLLEVETALPRWRGTDIPLLDLSACTGIIVVTFVAWELWKEETWERYFRRFLMHFDKLRSALSRVGRNIESRDHLLLFGEEHPCERNASLTKPVSKREHIKPKRKGLSMLCSLRSPGSSSPSVGSEDRGLEMPCGREQECSSLNSLSLSPSLAPDEISTSRLSKDEAENEDKGRSVEGVYGEPELLKWIEKTAETVVEKLLEKRNAVEIEIHREKLREDGGVDPGKVEGKGREIGPNTLRHATIDPSAVAGTGGDCSVLKEDVEHVSGGSDAHSLSQCSEESDALPLASDDSEESADCPLTPRSRAGEAWIKTRERAEEGDKASEEVMIGYLSSLGFHARGVSELTEHRKKLEAEEDVSPTEDEEDTSNVRKGKERGRNEGTCANKKSELRGIERHSICGEESNENPLPALRNKEPAAPKQRKVCREVGRERDPRGPPSGKPCITSTEESSKMKIGNVSTDSVSQCEGGNRPKEVHFKISVDEGVSRPLVPKLDPSGCLKNKADTQVRPKQLDQKPKCWKFSPQLHSKNPKLANDPPSSLQPEDVDKSVVSQLSVEKKARRTLWSERERKAWRVEGEPDSRKVNLGADERRPEVKKKAWSTYGKGEDRREKHTEKLKENIGKERKLEDILGELGRRFMKSEEARQIGIKEGKRESFGKRSRNLGKLFSEFSEFQKNFEDKFPCFARKPLSVTPPDVEMKESKVFEKPVVVRSETAERSLRERGRGLKDTFPQVKEGTQKDGRRPAPPLSILMQELERLGEANEKMLRRAKGLEREARKVERRGGVQKRLF